MLLTWPEDQHHLHCTTHAPLATAPAIVHFMRSFALLTMAHSDDGRPASRSSRWWAKLAGCTPRASNAGPGSSVPQASPAQPGHFQGLVTCMSRLRAHATRHRLNHAQCTTYAKGCPIWWRRAPLGRASGGAMAALGHLRRRSACPQGRRAQRLGSPDNKPNG